MTKQSYCASPHQCASPTSATGPGTLLGTLVMTTGQGRSNSKVAAALVVMHTVPGAGGAHTDASGGQRGKEGGQGVSARGAYCSTRRHCVSVVAVGHCVGAVPGVQAVANAGQLVWSGGQCVSAAGQRVSRGGQCVSTGGHTVCFAGHLVRLGGHRVATDGQRVSRGGHL